MVVQATLLFGTGSWVMFPRIGRTLGVFHHSVALKMENMQLKRYMAGRWIYLPLDVEIKAVVLEEVET